jgi:hypothetical protein
MSAAEYAKLLRKIVGGQLRMKAALGTHAVCTDPDTCPLAISAPIPQGEQWHYSIGHWVEDDPAVAVEDEWLHATSFRSDRWGVCGDGQVTADVSDASVEARSSPRPTAAIR